MEVLVTGASGFVGSQLIPRLQRDGHGVRAFARDPARVVAGVQVHVGDAVTGAGLEEALAEVDVAYFLIHSMERATNGTTFADRDRLAAERFAAAARAAGVGRVVYLGGFVPADAPPSRHLASRLEVEEILLDAAPAALALRASIVIAHASRSFRFLVRLVERLPVLALPGWRQRRTAPVDGRDVIELLARAGTQDPPPAEPRSLDAAGPDVLTYGEMIDRIRDHMLVGRPTLRFDFSATPVASRVAAAVAGEDPELVVPLMEGLEHDLLPRPGHDAGQRLGARMHSFDSAVEHALRRWEEREPLGAR